MKTRINTILLALSALALSACNQSGLDGAKGGEKGELVLTVNADTPATKAIVQVTDYPVAIKNSKGVEIYRYESVLEVPGSLTLEAGEYTVSSHTPGTLQKKMSIPYYAGSSDVSIKAGITSKAEVTCLMQNTKIAVVYGEDFFNVFSSWLITIDDGSSSVLQFTEADPRVNGESVSYWSFADGVSEVTLNFTGTTKEGNKISQKFSIKKSAANNGGYDNDNENFSGGDALNFIFTPEEATTGTVQSITLKAEISFTQTNEDITVNIEDVPTYPGGEDPGPEPPVTESIILTVPDPITLPEPDVTKGNVGIQAEKGIKSIMVTVTSTSQDMMDSLAGVAEGNEGVDLVQGCEVVGNNNLANFLIGLGKTMTVPAEGDTNYTFPVGNFFSLLTVMAGEHNFNMVVTDMEGHTKNGKIKITVPEED